MNLLLRFKSYLIILAVLSAMFGWGMWERSGKLSIKAEYDTFIIKAQILAAERLAENQRKEAEYRERLKTAEFAAAAARNRLREYTERPRVSTVPGSPQTADANTICWSTDRFSEGFRELERIITSGQEAVIDRTTLLESWPK